VLSSYFFERAFRPFFIGSLAFSVIAMFVWWWVYPDLTSYASFSSVNAFSWHGHEMVFGYALATVTGFLLTAMMNWSRMNLASGLSVAGIFLAWTLARVGYLVDWPIFYVLDLDDNRIFCSLL